MSATPQPTPEWTIIAAGWDDHEPDTWPEYITVKCRDPETAQKALNALAAFDALLAVAKAAARATETGHATGTAWTIDEAVVALYAAHPRWLEWYV